MENIIENSAYDAYDGYDAFSKGVTDLKYRAQSATLWQLTPFCCSELDGYGNSNPISQTLRICLFKANTLEAIAMSTCACTCGRSPTDNCVGWHNLTEEKYLEKKAAHEARKAEKAT
jgi:hypothetical protein